MSRIICYGVSIMSKLGLVFFAVWNLIVFSIYGADKLRAIKNRRRISEKALLWCAFLMGGTGALLGMYTLRHKTRKLRFKVLVPASLFVNLGILWVLERI